MDNRGKRQAASIFGGMGFYIALLVCAVAAGVVGYYALMNNEAPPQEDPVQAEYLGVSRWSVHNYESGKNRPDYEGLLKLADYFEVSLDYLTGRTDER